jgi:cytoskeleton protein RodZ
MKAFGDRLREAREAKSISLRSVAASTRISERYLHALERSDLDALPGGVFDKGYIKSYAQFLDIDPKPLLESYGIEERKHGRGTPDAEREKLEELARLVRTRPGARPRAGTARVLMGIAIVSLVILGSATAWWVFRAPAPPPEPKRVSDEPATVSRSLAVPDEPAEPTPPAAAPESTLSVPQMGVGTGIVERNLVGQNDRFPVGTRVWFWTRIVGGRDGDRVRHAWRHDGRVYMNARLPIGGSHWRTYSTLELPAGTEGEWTLEVHGEEGAVLAQTTFVAVSPNGGT